MKRTWLVTAGVCVGFGCAPAPVYDQELGVQAIGAEEGALAGTFALKIRSLTLEETPVLGEQEGGGINFVKVTRTYDAEAGLYRQQSQLCGGFSYPVAGVGTSMPFSTYQQVAPSVQETVEVDHDRGTYRERGHLQLWALRDLPDPYNTPLPFDAAEAEQAPHRDHIYDHEDDGKPGVTIFIDGFISGEIYGVQRKKVELDGVILGPDQALGFARLQKESVQLGANNDLLKLGAGSARDHPDPKESWFFEIRIADDAGCDEVLAAEEDGRLPAFAPF